MGGFEPGQRVEQGGDFFRLVEHLGVLAWNATHEGTGIACMLSEADFRRMDPKDEDAERAGMMATLNNVGMLRAAGLPFTALIPPPTSAETAGTRSTPTNA